ncbi:hypothetical protein B0J18DRAFT_301456 [Chaetomium sp. MPI-SDFR-AT-0129]|nr:hypothetical protein B0J18DRAFT_301456 [Chaetomium sp. MPI-SDFR-AT-0129]
MRAPESHLPPVRPFPELQARENILIRHPGYPTQDLLLIFPRVDSEALVPDHHDYGVHHGTVLVACQITAGNAFTNSYLSLDKEGQQRVQTPLHGVLTEHEYYFIVEGYPLYPIVPSFQDWEFPHHRIPEWWHPLHHNPNVTMACGVTNSSYAVEEAHLVPEEERAWYSDNEMEFYGWGPLRDIDNKTNRLPLRSDIRTVFDNRWFVIVPKVFTTGSSIQQPPEYVTHIMVGEAWELWPTHHNTVVQSLHRCSREYLFARFAWTILFQVRMFVIGGRHRHVIRRVTTADEEREYKVQYCSGEELEEAYGILESCEGSDTDMEEE